MSVAVVTDSAASLPPELVERHGIGVVPIHVMIGESSQRDGEVPMDEVVARLGEGVSTSGPAPGEFAEVIERALESSDAVLVLTIASTMSSTHDAAEVAARSAGGGRARVVDTRTAAGAEALVVLAAANEAERGGDLDAVEAAARGVAERVRLVATVDSLDQLVRSGRVPNLAGLAGRYLGVNPLFEFSDGRARPLRPAFSRQAAIDRILQACRGQRDDVERLHVAALHAADADTARELLDAACEGGSPAESFVGSFSPGMVAHTGPGLAGLAWWWEGPPS